jgi:hypothetical protein
MEYPNFYEPENNLEQSSMLNMQDYSELGKRVLCIISGIGDVRQEYRRQDIARFLSWLP